MMVIRHTWIHRLSLCQNVFLLLIIVLDLNKIEAGKLELENVAFDLRGLVSDIEEVYRLIADSKVQWSVSVDERVPRIIVGDPTRLRQMMTNFISNSFKFTRQGSVALRIIFIKDLGNKVTVSFSVVDTGLGIAADNIPKLFRAYSQAQASILRDFGGTGLGLSIVKSLADAMGGRVQVQSTIGKGSTFSFELTMDKAEADPPSQHHIVSTRQSG
jgi:signal transduction histidine kinase